MSNFNPHCTRTFYCEECAKSHRPAYGQHFLVIGGDSNQYYRLQAKSNGIAGFTPHLIQTEWLGNDSAIIRVCCSMKSCGIDFPVTTDTLQYITILYRYPIVMPRSDYEALLLYRDETYQV